MRRRVHTISVPVVSELHQMYAAADEGAIAALLAKLAVEKSYVAKLDDTRQVLRVHLEMTDFSSVGWAVHHVRGVHELSWCTCPAACQAP